MYRLNTLAALCASVALASCATVVRGTTNDVVINYSPSDAKVTTSLNHTCNASPCTVKAPRKEGFNVTVSKPGYETKTVRVGTKVSKRGAAGMAGNVLIGGVIGVGVDAATGAAKDHYPNPVNVELLPTGSKPAQEPRLTPVKPTGKKDVPVS